MEMNKLVILLSAALTLNASAHDEGHGPKLTEAPKKGGVLAPLILASEASLGSKAKILYKGELVRSDTGGVTLYVYDDKMNALPLEKFAKTAKGDLEFKKGKKWQKLPFPLKNENSTFTGAPPKPQKKPYNIDIHLNDGTRDLLVAFDNLD